MERNGRISQWFNVWIKRKGRKSLPFLFMCLDMIRLNSFLSNLHIQVLISAVFCIPKSGFSWFFIYQIPNAKLFSKLDFTPCQISGANSRGVEAFARRVPLKELRFLGTWTSCVFFRHMNELRLWLHLNHLRLKLHLYNLRLSCAGATWIQLKIWLMWMSNFFFKILFKIQV